MLVRLTYLFQACLLSFACLRAAISRHAYSGCISWHLTALQARPSACFSVTSFSIVFWHIAFWRISAWTTANPLGTWALRSSAMCSYCLDQALCSNVQAHCLQSSCLLCLPLRRSGVHHFDTIQVTCSLPQPANYFASAAVLLCVSIATVGQTWHRSVICISIEMTAFNFRFDCSSSWSRLLYLIIQCRSVLRCTTLCSSSTHQLAGCLVCAEHGTIHVRDRLKKADAHIWCPQCTTRQQTHCQNLHARHCNPIMVDEPAISVGVAAAGLFSNV